jgi:signal transduction histidine kinase
VLTNAFQHAHAHTVELEIAYASDIFGITVCDDGSGMEAVMVTEGRSGHWGMHGMRERAERIGATLRISSRPHAGTNVELRVPSSIAFAADSIRRRWWRW